MFWDKALDPAILYAEARPRVPHDDGFDLRRLSSFAALLIDGPRECLCLSDGPHRLRIDVIGGSMLGGPISLRFLLEDDHALPVKLRELMRFRALCRRGTFADWLEPLMRQRSRWTAQIRALDAVAQGATAREIAAALFAARAAGNVWRIESDSLRSSVRRLIAAARRMTESGYRSIVARA